MTTHDKDKIIAAAKEADLFIGSKDDPRAALWWYPEIERFYTITFAAGAASRDAEIVGLNQRLDQLGESVLNKQAEIAELVAAIKFWMKAEGNYDLMKADKMFQEALAKVRKS